MKTGRYYVVKVKHTRFNILHKTIVRCIDEDKVVLDFINYSEYTRKSAEDLHYIEVISEIKEMND